MIRTSLIAVACAAALIALAACGGGGGGAPVTWTDQPTQAEREAAEQERLEREARERAEREAAERAAALLPFPLSSGGMQHVGIDQPYTRLDQLPLAGERGAINIHYGHFNDGAGRETVAAYLTEAWPGVVGRFSAAPIVRVIGPSTARERQIVADAVDAINLSLPLDLRMQLAPPDPQRSLRDRVRSNGRYYGGHERPAITIEFLDCADYVKCGRASATTWASDGYGPPSLERGGYVQFSRGSYSYSDDWQARVLMAHELLHVVSADKHVGRQFDSIMTATDHYSSGTASLLSPLDREALNALYRRLEPGDDPASLGLWASSSLHLAANGPHANFGVALRNGYAEPWATGPMPTTTLANNPALSGTVEWIGTVLGFTPAVAAVTGDAQIAVELSTLAGATVFTDLEEWAGAPRAAGTGTMWGDGDLAYNIAVTGNTFRETGGDDGRLTGIFTGAAHEGAAGTLERTDLTAAFGASR